MAKHLIITAVTLIIITAVFFAYWGRVDSPTSGSRDALLAEMTLPSNLPTINPSNNSGDAATDYHKAIELNINQFDKLRSKNPDAQVVKQLVRLIRQGAGKSSVTFGFADGYIPMEPMAKPEYRNAPAQIATVVLNEADRLDDKVGKDLMLDLWVFGYRLYKDNLRIIPRMSGLGTMQQVYARFERKFGTDDPKYQAMGQWIAEADKITIAWNEKLKALATFYPNVGDLVRFVQMDTDKSFRLEALLRMGEAQWRTNVRANLSALHGVMQTFANGEDKNMTQAARAAQEFTRENVRMIN